jgi:hypothetical protein
MSRQLKANVCLTFVLTAFTGAALFFVSVWGWGMAMIPFLKTPFEDVIDDFASVYVLLKTHIGRFAVFLLPFEKTLGSAFLRPLLNWLNPRKHTWNAIVLFGIFMGVVLALAEAMSEGGGSRQIGQFAIVVAVFIGLEGSGVLVGYAFLGSPLGLFRHDSDENSRLVPHTSRHDFLVSQESLAPATYNRRLAALRSFIGFLHDRGWITEALLEGVERKPEGKSAARALDAQKVESVLRGIENPRDRALFWLIYDGGLRCQEARPSTSTTFPGPIARFCCTAKEAIHASRCSPSLPTGRRWDQPRWRGPSRGSLLETFPGFTTNISAKRSWTRLLHESSMAMLASISLVAGGATSVPLRMAQSGRLILTTCWQNIISGMGFMGE